MASIPTGNKVGHIGSLTSGGAMVATLLVLSGCSFSYNYSKPGVSQQQRAQDHFECKQASRQPYIVGNRSMMMGGSEPTWETYKECLEGRGYTVTIADSEESNSSSSSRPAAATTPDAFANIRNAEDMQKHLDSERQFLDRKVAAGQITQKEADLLHQDRKEFLTKRLNIPESSVSASQGSHCAPSNATIGTQVKPPNGKMVKVTALYGNSPRCSDPATPILVDVEEVGEGESSASTVQSGGWMYDRGVKYANGMGVPQDDVRAYMWYSLAVPQLTGVQQRFAADGRDYVVRRMTPAQIAEAQRLSQQCQTQQFKGC